MTLITIINHKNDIFFHSIQYIYFALGPKNHRNRAYENRQWFWDPITYLKNSYGNWWPGGNKSDAGFWTNIITENFYTIGDTL